MYAWEKHFQKEFSGETVNLPEWQNCLLSLWEVTSQYQDLVAGCDYSCVEELLDEIYSEVEGLHPWLAYHEKWSENCLEEFDENLARMVRKVREATDAIRKGIEDSCEVQDGCVRWSEDMPVYRIPNTEINKLRSAKQTVDQWASLAASGATIEDAGDGGTGSLPKATTESLVPEPCPGCGKPRPPADADRMCEACRIDHLTALKQVEIQLERYDRFNCPSETGYKVEEITRLGPEDDRTKELADSGNEQTPNQKKKRGRPRDTDLKDDKKIYEAWQTKQYKTYEDLGREMGLTKREVKLAIDRHRKRLSNRRKKSG